MKRASAILFLDLVVKQPLDQTLLEHKSAAKRTNLPSQGRSQTIKMFKNILIEHLKSFGLTRRETEIALLLLKGKTQTAIAKQTKIQLSTVKYHMSNIYEKVGCKSKTDFFDKTYKDLL